MVSTSISSRPTAGAGPGSTDSAHRAGSIDAVETNDTVTVALPWLLRFRWAVLAGQLLLVGAGRPWLGLSIPAWVVAIPVGVAASNLAGRALTRRFSAATVAAGLLLLDIVLLTALLAATGGAANPFTILYLVQIALSALVLRPRWTWLMAAASVVGFSSLFLFSPRADPHAVHGMAMNMASHLRGMWAAFVLAALATALFVTLLRRSLDRRERELAGLRDLALRYDRLATLSTFAAGAAHELATPLGTIALVAAETETHAASGANEIVRRDLRTIRSEVERCRVILDDLAGRAGETAGEIVLPTAPQELVREALDRLSAEERRCVRFDGEATDEIGVVLNVPRRALVRSLVTLLRNAFDASVAGGPIEIRVTREAGWVSLAVLDRGAGPSRGLFERVGEPFLTTKGEGLGLGLFAAKRLLDLLGGELRLAARPGGGAFAELRLPLIAPTEGLPKRR